MLLTPTILLSELRARLTTLRKRHRALPWVNVSRLDQLCHQTARALKAPATRTERIKLEREIWLLTSRLQGIYHALNTKAKLPDWLKPGGRRISGQAKAKYLREFFVQSRQRPELTSAFAKFTGRPWREYEQLYSRWRVLSVREEKEAAAYPAAVRRLRRLLIAARGIVGVLKP